MTTHKYDLTQLKNRIAHWAAETRDLREHARAATGEKRWEFFETARDFGDQRYLLLAYGYLRGRTICEMESETTLPENLPEAGPICHIAKPYFMAHPDSTEESWEAFAQKIQDDLDAWVKTVRLARMEKEARRRATKQKAVA